MGNPVCPKCHRVMQSKELLVESRTNAIGRKVYGRVKFWVCPNKSPLHGTVKFRRGAQVIM